MTLTTERLLLRPWTEQDAADLFEFARDPRIGPVAGWRPHTSVADSREIIRTVLSGPEIYAVVPHAAGRPVGSAGIMFGAEGSAPMAVGEAEIGYWIGVPYWGMGLIPEAVERLLARCFTELAVDAVWCGYYEGNEKSRRVQEKCGFLPHHKEENRLCPLGDYRTEYFTYQTKAEWNARQSKKCAARNPDAFAGPLA